MILITSPQLHDSPGDRHARLSQQTERRHFTRLNHQQINLLSAIAELCAGGIAGGRLPETSCVVVPALWHLRFQEANGDQRIEN